MAWPPNSQERRRAELYADSPEAEEMLAVMLAEYREELLKPIDEMQRDYESLGDVRVARDLREILKDARGKP